MGSPWTGSMKGSMDRVRRGGPWTWRHVLYTSHFCSGQRKEVDCSVMLLR